MNRQHKEAVIESLQNDFAQSSASFVVGLQGLTVAQMQKLRKELRSNGGKLKVAKARLIKRAAHDLACSGEQLDSYFKDQIGVVFASQEIPTIAKILHTFAQDNQALRLIGGCVESTVLDAHSVVRIASLPSRQVLLAQVCGTIQAPLSGLVTTLNGVMLKLVWTLKQVGDKKQ